jgi:hypothetical protein
LTGEKCQSRHNERYDTVADAPAVDAVVGHRLNDRPFLPKESRSLVYVHGVYFDTTRPPSTLARYLKEEGVANRFPIAINRRSFLSHSVSPWFASNRSRLHFQFWFSCGAIVTQKKLVRSVANIWQLERGENGVVRWIVTMKEGEFVGAIEKDGALDFVHEVILLPNSIARLDRLRQESRCFRRTVKGARLVMTQQIDIPVEPGLLPAQNGRSYANGISWSITNE